MDNEKYITLEQNIKKLENCQNALVSLEGTSNYTFAWHRHPNYMRRLHKKCVRRTKRNIKRLLVVIEKQSKLTK